MDSVIRVELLGGLRLWIRGDGEAPELRRRLLALLALIASSADAGISRDQLLQYLWPDSNDAHAHNNLNQALTALRRALGPDAILGAQRLRLDPGRFSCDLWQYEGALRERRLAEAIELYGGAFLGAFALPRASEFEQWVDCERERLRRRFVSALEMLATDAAAAGDLLGAVGWWRRLAEEEPFSARVAQACARSLLAAGEEAAALEHTTRYADRIRRVLDAEPEVAIIALTRALRTRSVVAASSLATSSLLASRRAVVVEP